MKVIFFCILKLIFVSTGSSQSDVPCHICEYNGVGSEPTVNIPFSVSDMPKRCEMVGYGDYYFDGADCDDKYMFEKDEIAIKSLVAAGIPVYTYLTYDKKENWNEIFNPTDQAVFNKKILGPLIKKLKDLQVTGVIFNIMFLYSGIPDYPNKIKAFITKLKEQIPDLKFGLNIFGAYVYDKVLNKKDFDYSITNSVIDLYMVDMNINNYECTPKLSCDGTPITSSDKTKLTMEVISNAIFQSDMDKTKLIACVNIFPITPHQFEVYTSYSKYCDDLGEARAETWCIEKSQRLYDIGKFLKKQKFAGVAVDWIEWDDIEVQCQCDKFPVTNLIFDGWDGCPIKPCPKIG